MTSNVPVPVWLAPELTPSLCTLGSDKTAQVFERIGELVFRLLGNDLSYLHVSRSELDGGHDGFFLTVGKQEGGSHFTRDTLLESLEAASGVEQMIRCAGQCGQLKPRGEFVKKTNGSGVGGVCKVCERTRSTKSYKKKRRRQLKHVTAPIEENQKHHVPRERTRVPQ